MPSAALSVNAKNEHGLETSVALCRSIAVAASLFSSHARDDIVCIKAIITELFNPPAFGCGLLVSLLTGVLVEDEVPLVRFVRQAKPLDGFSVFFFACIFSLTSMANRGADLVNAFLIHWRELRSGVLRNDAYLYNAPRRRPASDAVVRTTVLTIPSLLHA